MKFAGVKDEKFQAEVARVHAESLAVVAERAPEVLPILEAMPVELSARLATCGGTARTELRAGRACIKLNYRLLSVNFSEIQSTYRHELAHVVANFKYNANCHHDARWRAMAVALGDDGGRCHTMDVSAFRKPQARYAWKCSCKTYSIAAGRHRRLKRLESHYGTAGKCAKCSETVTFVGRIATIPAAVEPPAPAAA